MASQKRAKVEIATDSPISAGHENEADGSQGSVDHIVQNMANALKESVIYLQVAT